MSDQPFVARWVSPFYLRILHANYCWSKESEEREQFDTAVLIALTEVTPDIASQLISGYWREAITGSWFAGLKCFTQCQKEIGELLLASKTCFAGQSHAFAMACYANNSSVDYLVEYLNVYLRRPECYYDQSWAMPALMWIDHRRGTNHSDTFLEENGLWSQFTAGKISSDNDAWRIERCKSNFWRAMQYCQRNYSLD